MGGTLLGEFRRSGRRPSPTWTPTAGTSDPGSSVYPPGGGAVRRPRLHPRTPCRGGARAASPSGSGRAICRASSISRYAPPSGPSGIWPGGTSSSSHIPFVAITGSVGKTTTKDMVAAVLGEKYQGPQDRGQLQQRHRPAPDPAAARTRTHEICVLEMGMNHAGEIEYLSAIVEPDVALITNIGDSHIENLGSREKILKAKCEIFSHMDARKGYRHPQRGRRAAATLASAQLPFETVFVVRGRGPGIPGHRCGQRRGDGASDLPGDHPAAGFRRGASPPWAATWSTPP